MPRQTEARTRWSVPRWWLLRLDVHAYETKNKQWRLQHVESHSESQFDRVISVNSARTMRRRRASRWLVTGRRRRIEQSKEHGFQLQMYIICLSAVFILAVQDRFLLLMRSVVSKAKEDSKELTLVQQLWNVCLCH